MIQYLRSLFGWNGAANRTVVGKQASIDIKDIPYIQDSNTRLNLLLHLYNRYKGTAHASKIKAVYDKTKKLHTYLIAKKKVHELELFHIQNTDHFISTFTAILEVHQRNQDASATSSKAGSKYAADANPKIISQSANVHPEPVALTLKSGDEVPQLVLPAISINTFDKITYERTDETGNLILQEISSTSTKQEKDNFLSAISSRLGVYKLDIFYVGNAQVHLPKNDGSIQTEIVPIVNWKGCLYIFSLNDYRFFPIRINRKGSIN
jgi:hypothetical protein